VKSENSAVTNSVVKLSKLELRHSITLAGIYGCRLLGLFMVLPVLALYIQTMPGATSLTIGLGIGVYGIFQALLQIPFGILSDRFGRKALISIGLIIFIIGSVICALASQIEWFIVGRAIQGAGAIGSTINALVADLTKPELRSKAMAVVGMGVGGTFLVAMLLGPLLSLFTGVPGLFILASIFGCFGLVLLNKFIPQLTPITTTANHLHWQKLAHLLKHPDCLRLDLSIFLLHAILTISFVAVPLLLLQLDINSQYVSLIYIPVLLVAFIITMVGLSYAERHQRLKSFLIIAIACFTISQLGLALLPPNLINIIFTLTTFFTAFVFLEANLPALITRVAPIESRGGATGIFSCAQFCGIFVGGLIGGRLYQQTSTTTILITTAIISCIWLLLILPLQIPKRE